MALGYEGIALFNDGVSDLQFLCTGLSLPRTRNKIESQSGFGGTISSSLPTRGIQGPRTYDWDSNEGNFSFEATPEFLTALKSWIMNRNTSREIKFYPARGSDKDFVDCLWTSISLSTSEGSPVSGTCSFISVRRDSETYGDDYINNREGKLMAEGWQGGIPPTLNAGNANKGPIPFWKSILTSADILPSPTAAQLLSWDLTFNQTVEKYFTCSGIYVNPVEPFLLGIGMMTIDFKTDIYILASSYTVPSSAITQATLSIDTVDFILQNLEIQEESQDLKTANDISTVPMSFSVYGLSAA